jgi:hypothetical protein
VIRRRLFAVASAISLLMFAVTVAMWVHLRRLEWYAVSWDWGGSHLWLTIGWGHLQILKQPPPPIPFATITTVWPVECSIPLAGFGVLFAILPLAWTGWALKRSFRVSGGSCDKCGYSLTGNTSGICPECGTPVPKEPAEKSRRTA